MGKDGRRNWPAEQISICSPSGTRRVHTWPGWNGIIPTCPGMGARLKLVRFDSASGAISDEHVISGDREHAYHAARVFAADGRWLSFIRGASEWEDLVLLDLERGEEHILVQGDGFFALRAGLDTGTALLWLDACKQGYILHPQPGGDVHFVAG